MPLSRLENLAQMIVSVVMIPRLTGLTPYGAREQCCLCCTEQRCSSARKTNGRNIAGSRSRIAAGSNTLVHLGSRRLAAVPPTGAPILQSLGLIASGRPFACRRS